MARPPAALVGRIGVSLALLAFGALSAMSGLDRMASRAPAAALLPPFLRAQSARSSAAVAIARRDTSSAIVSARQAVAADPVNAASTALLGSAYLLDGQDGRAEQSFRIAARFGWREPATQLYWYDAALQADDLPRAAERADALLRTHYGLWSTEDVLKPLERTPAGRAALIRRMAERPEWLTFYLRLERPDPDLLDRRSEVLAGLGRQGTSLGCDVVTPLVQTALDHGSRRQAERVWRAHCPGATLDDGLTDGGFDHFEKMPGSPFGWRAQLSGDVALRVVNRAGGGRALELRNDAPVSRLVLTQAISVAPGAYRLTGKSTSGRIAGSIGCDGPPQLPNLTDGDMSMGGQSLSIPRCSTLILGLWLRPGTGTVELDDVALERGR